MAEQRTKEKAAGYDRYINWKMFLVPLGLLIILLLLPTPKSMLDVGVEYAPGPAYVKDYFARELFEKTKSVSLDEIRKLELDYTLAVGKRKQFEIAEKREVVEGVNPPRLIRNFT